MSRFDDIEVDVHGVSGDYDVEFNVDEVEVGDVIGDGGYWQCEEKRPDQYSAGLTSI